MTLDQYLGTVAWLSMATTIALLILCVRDCFVAMNRHQPVCDCRKCTGPYGIKRKLAKVDCSTFVYIPAAFFFIPISQFMLGYWFKARGDRLKMIIFKSVLIWSAYPIYLWVSTSFAFNIAYIGG